MSIEERVRGIPTKLFTLIVVRKEDETLLGLKKRGFATNKWNGFGGKVEPGETIVESAKRELKEECGLVAKSLKKLGILYFKNESWEKELHEVHLFLADEYEGEIQESDGERMRNTPSKLFTLVIVHNEEKILLGLKKRGLGQGKWNGFGGKVEAGESIIHAAKRELKEECGLAAKSLKKLGVLYFENANWADITLYEVHLFTTTEYEGEVIESEEMRPEWFALDNLPFDKMWSSNKYWLPKAIAGKSFDAFFVYENEDTLVEIDMDEHQNDLPQIEFC